MSESRMSECWVQWKAESGAEDAETFKAAYMAGQNDPAPWQVAAIEREAAARALEEAANEIVAVMDEPGLPDDFLRGFDSGAADVLEALRARAAGIREGER